MAAESNDCYGSRIDRQRGVEGVGREWKWVEHPNPGLLCMDFQRASDRVNLHFYQTIIIGFTPTIRSSGFDIMT